MMPSDDSTIKSSSALHVPLASNPRQALASNASMPAIKTLQVLEGGAAHGAVSNDTSTNYTETPASSPEQPAPTPVSIALRNHTSARHVKQQIDPLPNLVPIYTPEFPTPANPLLPINDKYQRFSLSADANGTLVPNQAFLSLDKKPLLLDAMYLFNVIVALEWKPSLATIQQLMSALRSASDFLYDCTNGNMAFGQVILAIDTLLDKSDIQIMASNRFHPRSLVNALNDPSKFSPIRIGRGLWDKSNSVLIGWDEPIAYRTIIHEWGHYALSLRDEYIDEAKFVKTDNLRLVDAELNEQEQTLVVPRLSVVLESIMARLEASEIVPLQRKGISDALRKRLLNELELWYPGVSLGGSANAGPDRLPMSLPQFHIATELDIHDSNYHPEEALLQVDNTQNLDPCWLYLLRWNAETSTLESIKAQGTIDARAQKTILDKNDVATSAVEGIGFQLLGDTKGSEVLAIGYDTTYAPNGPKMLRIQRTLLKATTGTGDNRTYNPSWKSSNALPALPIITVLPTDASVTWPDVELKVQVVARSQPTCVWIVPIGQKPVKLGPEPIPYRGSIQKSLEYSVWESNSFRTTFLDGLVVLQYGTGAKVDFWVCEYSHGGNPPTSIRSPSSPVSAGSSDGNLMLYCRTTEDPKLFSHTRVITTRNYSTFSQKRKEDTNGTADLICTTVLKEDNEVYGPEGDLPGVPASYLFSVASNVDIGTVLTDPPGKVNLNPTIVMYFDLAALEDKSYLVIHRYDITTGTWKPLPTYQQPGTFFAAIPLTDLLPNQIAYYQLFRLTR